MSKIVCAVNITYDYLYVLLCVHVQPTVYEIALNQKAQKEPSGTSAEQESSLTEAIPVFDVDKLTSPNQSNFNYTLIKSKPTFPPHLGICDDEGYLYHLSS